MNRAFLMPAALHAMLLKNRAILQWVDVNWHAKASRASFHDSGPTLQYDEFFSFRSAFAFFCFAFEVY